MFRDVLQEAVERTEGGIASLLMDFDGIAVDSFVNPNALGVSDVETIGIEYSVILKNVRQAVELLEAGDTQELSIRSAKLTTVIRVLNADYFLAMTLSPDGNFGKARFMLRTAATKLVAELS